MASTRDPSPPQPAYTVVTGAAGFIGSRLACKLREKRGAGRPLLLVDDLEFSRPARAASPSRR